MIRPQPKRDRHAERAKPARIDYQTLALGKDIPVPDAKYRAWVRGRGCVLRIHV